ncbi:hypothetical protein RDI58_012111 [Solanum bulbocastanum]|uniref:Uncharacterized protein n=1 Tax=Solanum bulbocastanum TaxID=147425 RepID=A0AAN8YHP1_SOLBU
MEYSVGLTTKQRSFFMIVSISVSRLYKWMARTFGLILEYQVEFSVTQCGTAMDRLLCGALRAIFVVQMQYGSGNMMQDKLKHSKRFLNWV